MAVSETGNCQGNYTVALTNCKELLIDRRVEGAVTLVLAHRGYTGEPGDGTVRENTLEAFAAARRRGADGVELDVRLSADGALVVHHDAEIPGLGRLANLAVAALPGWVPLLADALAGCAGLVVNVEVKHDPADDPGRTLAARVAAELAADAVAGWAPPGPPPPGGGVLVSSFDAASLDVVVERAPEVPTGLLVHWAADPATGLAEAEAHGCRAVHPFVGRVDRDYVEAARRRCLGVNVWTVNADEDLSAMGALGVDAVITDRLPAALAAVGRPPPNGGTGAP